MLKFLGYLGRFQAFRGSMGALPAWARLLVMLAALPGILLIGLSIVAFVVSLFVLLLLAGPVYRVVGALAGEQKEMGQDVPGDYGDVVIQSPPPSRPRRQIDVNIIE